jgi:hypothetical protein
MKQIAFLNEQLFSDEMETKKEKAAIAGQYISPASQKARKWRLGFLGIGRTAPKTQPHCATAGSRSTPVTTDSRLISAWTNRTRVFLCWSCNKLGHT